MDLESHSEKDDERAVRSRMRSGGPKEEGSQAWAAQGSVADGDIIKRQGPLTTRFDNYHQTAQCLLFSSCSFQSFSFNSYKNLGELRLRHLILPTGHITEKV